MSDGEELVERFECFGSSCTVLLAGDGQEGSARAALGHARGTLTGWHEGFSRFLDDSELSRLNADPRWEVPVSPLMALLAQAVVTAGSLSGGLVDATMIEQIERAGYQGDLAAPLPLEYALALAPPRAPARAAATGGWTQLEVDLARATVTRPPGVKMDSGGLAKGLFADLLAARLASHPAFAINCAGDLAIGGAGRIPRPIRVESPFDGHTIHTFELISAGVATSGITRRSWLGRDGRPAHHLLDPSTGAPAFTGIVQVTALAPNALMAEIHAKAAILSGPRAAPGWLPHGGVVVLEDGSHEVIEPPMRVTLSQLPGFTHSRPTGEIEDV